MEKHTDLKVGKYWGEMGVDYWDAATWKQQKEEYEVVVLFFICSCIDCTKLYLVALNNATVTE